MNQTILLKIVMRYMSINSRSVIFFLFMLLIQGCDTHTPYDYERIDTFLKTEYNFHHFSEYDRLIIINELGDCINCNNTFAKSVASKTDNEKLLFLISTPGTRVDISGFLSHEYENVLYDFHNNFSNLELVSHCAIINYSERSIDTIIEVTNSNLMESIAILE